MRKILSFIAVILILPLSIFAATNYPSSESFAFCEFLSVAGKIVDLADTMSYPILTPSSDWHSSGTDSYTDNMMLCTFGINRIYEETTLTLTSSTAFQYVSKSNPSTHRQFYIGIIGKKNLYKDEAWGHAFDPSISASGNVTKVSDYIYIIGNLNDTPTATITFPACTESERARWLDVVLIMVEDNDAELVSAEDYDSLLTCTIENQTSGVLQTYYIDMPGYYNHELTVSQQPGIILNVFPTSNASDIDFYSIKDGSSIPIGEIEISSYIKSSTNFKLFLSSSPNHTSRNVDEFCLLRIGDSQKTSTNSMNYTVTLSNKGTVLFKNPSKTEIEEYTFDGTCSSNDFVYVGYQTFNPSQRSYSIINYSLSAILYLTLDSQACTALRNSKLLAGEYASNIYFIVLTDN